MNPYAELDLPVDADEKAIRRAYRKRAKETHPDHGGNAEAFGRAKRSSVVLLDPVRRANYDRDGTIEEDAPDNSLSEVMQFVAIAINDVVAEAVGARREPEAVDLIAGAKEKLRAKQAEVRKQATALEYQRTYLTLAMARISAKQGKEDRITGMMKGQIGFIQQAEAVGQRHLKAIEEALALLSDHDFMVDRASQQNISGPFNHHFVQFQFG
jgi:DnaJ-class molecular chaperone